MFETLKNHILGNIEDPKRILNEKRHSELMAISKKAIFYQGQEIYTTKGNAIIVATIKEPFITKNGHYISPQKDILLCFDENIELKVLKFIDFSIDELRKLLDFSNFDILELSSRL